MAYFEDPAQIKIINFIPVRMVGASPSAALGSYSGLGNGATSSLQTRVMSARSIQLRLVTAGTLLATNVDGIFGPRSREAMRLFVRRLPASVRSMNIAWNSPFYRAGGRGQVVLPEAWAARLPREAVIPRGISPVAPVLPPVVQDGAAPAAPASAQPGAPADGSVNIAPEAPPAVVAPTDADPAAPESDETRDAPEGSAGRASKGKVPWMWIGVGAAALVAVGAVVVISRR